MIRKNSIKEYGLILNKNLFLDLLSKKENKNKVNEFLDWLEIDKIQNLSEYDLSNIAQEIGFDVYFDFVGQTNNNIYFENEIMFIMYLEKDSLFNKYENWEEIYTEIKDTLENFGIKIDNEFIKKYTDLIEGIYY